MDLMNRPPSTNIPPARGKLLIAEPFLTDPGFARSVVIICEHGAEGTLGFILNKPSSRTVNELLPELNLPPLTIFEGGPVMNDTLHMLHAAPTRFGGVEVTSGINWGGTYQELAAITRHDEAEAAQLRLFSGYAGWEKNQLDDELQKGAWLVTDASRELVFETPTNEVWATAMRMLGSDFARFIHVPLHPQLN